MPQSPQYNDSEWDLLAKILNNLSGLGGGATPIGAAGGTLGGTYPNPTIATGGSGNFTPGSVIFAGATGGLAQDNTSLFWNNTTKRLGIGNNAPDCSLSITNGVISVKDSGAFSERFGLLTVATGNSTLAVGYGAGATNIGNIALGKFADASAASSATVIGANASSAAGVATVVVGSLASASFTGATAIGSNASVTAAGGTAIGFAAVAVNTSLSIGSQASAAFTGSIAMGALSVTTAGGQFVAGAALGAIISDIYFGSGVVDTAPPNVTFNGTGGSGADVAAGSITIAGGKGTGNAAGGDILFKTSDAVASGATLQSLTTKVLVKAKGALSGTVDTMTYAAAITLDTQKGNLHKTTTVNATGNATINASDGGIAGQHIWIMITNDATLAKTITFGTNFKSSGVLIGTASLTGVVHFISDGTNFYEVARTLAL